MSKRKERERKMWVYTEKWERKVECDDEMRKTEKGRCRQTWGRERMKRCRKRGKEKGRYKDTGQNENGKDRERKKERERKM